MAVACSSAFPPVLSPHRLRTDGARWVDLEGNDLATPEHRAELVLSDGGVYDNLGLETAWKRCRTLIVSDAGGRMAAELHPEGDWPRHMLRVLRVIDNQVRSLRKEQVIEGLRRGARDGVYVGIRSDITDYGLAGALPAPLERTLELAELHTRLAALPEEIQERLVNWGYAIGDAGLRKHLDPGAAAPKGLSLSGGRRMSEELLERHKPAAALRPPVRLPARIGRRDGRERGQPPADRRSAR